MSLDMKNQTPPRWYEEHEGQLVEYFEEHEEKVSRRKFLSMLKGLVVGKVWANAFILSAIIYGILTIIALILIHIKG